jgi:hypothetical protein
VGNNDCQAKYRITGEIYPTTTAGRYPHSRDHYNLDTPEVSAILADMLCISKLFKSLIFQGK